MPETVLGLPLHPLVVHATVILVPLTALLVVLAAVSPRFRRWAGPLPLAAAVVSMVLVPLTAKTGENLEEALPSDNPLIEKHTDLGEMLIWWVLALLVVAAAQYFLVRGGRSVAKGLATGLLVLAVVVGVGTMVQTALIGHSGAKAVWDGVGQPVDD